MYSVSSKFHNRDKAAAHYTDIESHVFEIPYVEEDYRRNHYHLSRKEYEDLKTKEIVDKQTEARLEETIFDYFTGGKYKGFTYEEVWRTKRDYILWLYWNGKHPKFKKQLLQNIDMVKHAKLFFRRR
jgi:hypothetical protein